MGTKQSLACVALFPKDILRVMKNKFPANIIVLGVVTGHE